MLVLAVAAGIAGHLLLARLLVWLLVAILIWAAATLWLRTVAWRKGSVPYPQPLAPGESYDTAVRLTSVPNVPIDYRGWEGDKFAGKKLAANRDGDREEHRAHGVTSEVIFEREESDCAVGLTATRRVLP